MENTSDVELLERWRAGDMKAGQSLFQRYYEPIERFFINKVSIDVADLVQDTFVACLKGRDGLRDPGKFRAWIFRIAGNVLISYLRKRYTRGTEIDILEQSVQDIKPGPFTLMVECEEEKLLLMGLRHIPIHYQVILELSYWENLSAAEIGDILELAEGTVKSRMRRGKELMREALARLAESPDLVQSTMSNLDDWIEKIRGVLAAISLTRDGEKEAGEPEDGAE